MRYGVVLEVMSGRIFTKFDIARPRHSFDPNTLKLAVCNTGIGLYKSYISDFVFHIIDLRSGQLRDLSIIISIK